MTETNLAVIDMPVSTVKTQGLKHIIGKGCLNFALSVILSDCLQKVVQVAGPTTQHSVHAMLALTPSNVISSTDYERQIIE